jgi:outer membrane protein assembly factor BamB
LSKYGVDPDMGLTHTFIERGTISSKRKNGTISLTEFPNKEIWKLKIVDYVNAQTPMPTIDNVYFHDNKIYTLCGHNIICTSLNGTLVWNCKLEFRPTFLEMDKNIGYIVSSNNLVILNLNNGTIFYSRKMNQINWLGHEYSFHGFRPQLHDQKLWCPLQTNGLNFVACLNPENGVLEWLQNIETPHFIQPPKFDDNKMFILDNGGNLFIYDKTTG